jgi:carotenoid cleavage dioxygenase-like enzyme
MKTQIYHSFESKLPADDTHPYRTGPWRPQSVEYDAWELDVKGHVPEDLNGVYLRNTENPILPSSAHYHPFDGDAMLHSIVFQSGEATYRNRFVRTEGFLAEQAAQESLWSGIIEDPNAAKRSDGWGARTRMKDASSTDVVVHRGVALSSFWQCGDLYRLDPRTLEDLGKEDWSGRFPKEGISAHPKIDEQTGEMLIFNYGKEAPYMHYGVVSPQGELAHYIDVPLPGPRLPHDMAFTENYAIVNDCPMFWDPDLLAAGRHVVRYYPDLPTRFGIIPRRGSTEEIRWFEGAPTYVLHWINAYEDGDEIVLDGYFQENPSPMRLENMGVEEHVFQSLDLFNLATRPHRWRFNMVTGQTREERITDRVLEFGMINGRYSGRRYRYSYSALPAEGWFGFRGIVKYDHQLGSEEVITLPDGVFASETVMAPRDGSQAEDDGYLITFTIDMNQDRSECLILDAANPTNEPIARISLPERISCGTHSCWAPLEALHV